VRNYSTWVEHRNEQDALKKVKEIFLHYPVITAPRPMQQSGENILFTRGKKRKLNTKPFLKPQHKVHPPSWPW
jgi:hypothetical protein